MCLICFLLKLGGDEADESLVVTKVKKKPTAFIDSESEDETEEVAPPKNERKNNIVTNIESSDESDDDTGIFQDAESGILEPPQQTPDRGEYNVENLKLIRHHHKNCKTQMMGNYFLSICFPMRKEFVRFFT